jgi:hypothetical protein
MNHETPGAAPADDFPFLGPAVSPRRRDVAAPFGGAGELAAPFVSHPSAAQPATPQPAPEPDRHDEELEPLPGAGWPSDDFPWLTPAEPQAPAPQAEPSWGAAASAGGEASASAEEDEGFPWDEDAAVEAGEGAGGFGWEGEPMIGGEGSERASSAAWGIDPEEEEPGVEDLYTAPAAGYSWHEEAEVVEEAADLTVSSADELAGEDAPGWTSDATPSFERPERAPEPSGWAWSDAGSESAEELLGERWEGSEESFTVDEEATVAGVPESAVTWEPVDGTEGGAESEAGFQSEAGFASGAGFEPGAGVAGGGGSGAGPESAPVEAVALPVGEWEAQAGVVEVQEEARAGEPAAAAPLEDVAVRLERIARALRTGKPDEALEQGDPLQLLITGYALGYAEARKGRG